MYLGEPPAEVPPAPLARRRRQRAAGRAAARDRNGACARPARRTGPEPADASFTIQERDIADLQIQIGGEAPVQPQLLVAQELAPLERAHVDERVAHRPLDLVGKLDRPAVPRRYGSRRARPRRRDADRHAPPAGRPTPSGMCSTCSSAPQSSTAMIATPARAEHDST